MDLTNVRRASSAGYRLPERVNGTRPVPSQPATGRTRHAEGDAASATADTGDPVKQDQVWKELVWGERRGVREWEKNWSFLRNYDQRGQLKTPESFPGYVSLFSDRVPNTTNQMFGSRLSSPLGRELIRVDRLLPWYGSHHRRKQDPEILPF
ncbi:ciliary microtubule inner protein 5 [Aulostomus maculatus]